eukprot:m.867160 g.867160  ORF g.867160 m.867160 type:complete len:1068 (+) comp59725_c0_seq26:54-3257(+)
MQMHCVALLLFAALASAESAVWGSGLADGLWSEGQRWVDGHAPCPEDTATFPAGEYTVTLPATPQYTRGIFFLGVGTELIIPNSGVLNFVSAATAAEIPVEEAECTPKAYDYPPIVYQAGSGNETSWINAAVWSPSHVPCSTDSPILNSSVPIVISASAGPQNLSSLNLAVGSNAVLILGPGAVLNFFSKADAYALSVDDAFCENQPVLSNATFTTRAPTTTTTGTTTTTTGGFNINSNGTTSYVVDGVANKNLTLYRGSTYVFNVNSANPFYIKTQPIADSTTSIFTTGVSNNGVLEGTLMFTVPQSAPDTLYYQSSAQASMSGVLTILSPPTTTTVTTTTRTTTTRTTTRSTTTTRTTTATTTTSTPRNLQVVNSGSSSYTIDGVTNPTLTFTRGNTYTFSVSASGHPFYIKTVRGTGTTNVYAIGVTGNGVTSGTLTFTVPLDAPNTLFYQCSVHSGMSGTINIVTATTVSTTSGNFGTVSQTGATTTVTGTTTATASGAATTTRTTSSTRTGSTTGGGTVTDASGPDSSSSSSIGPAIGGAVGGIILLILIIVIIVVLRKKRDPQSSHARTEQGSIKARRGVDHAAEGNLYAAGAVGVMEVQRDDLTTHECIGSFTDAEFFLGRYFPRDAPRERTVMAKKFRTGITDTQVSQEVEVLKEAGSHKFIVSLIGHIRESFPMFLLLELMELGNLRDYLRRCRGSLSAPQSIHQEELVSFTSQIAQGMAYLESKKIVHAHLAARSVLVGKQGHSCKISEVERHGADAKPLGLDMTYAWYSPEVLTSDLFSTKSDVWAFGVTVWEIMTMGASPFCRYESARIKSAVCRGERLPIPEGSLTTLPRIMQGCWEQEPVNRPTFAVLVNWTRTMMNDTEHESGYAPRSYLPFEANFEEPAIMGVDQASRSLSVTRGESLQSGTKMAWSDSGDSTWNSAQYAVGRQSEATYDTASHRTDTNKSTVWNPAVYAVSPGSDSSLPAGSKWDSAQYAVSASGNSENDYAAVSTSRADPVAAEWNSTQYAVSSAASATPPAWGKDSLPRRREEGEYVDTRVADPSASKDYIQIEDSDL